MESIAEIVRDGRNEPVKAHLIEGIGDAAGIPQNQATIKQRRHRPVRRPDDQVRVHGRVVGPETVAEELGRLGNTPLLHIVQVGLKAWTLGGEIH